MGDPSAGAKASGVDWPAGERVARFCEFVELVDLLLRQEVTTYHGQFYRCQEAETAPLPVQQPRPPVTIAAHGPKMLRIAAEHADGWSSWGGYDVASEEAFYDITADRSHRFDDLCVGRQWRRRARRCRLAEGRPGLCGERLQLPARHTIRQGVPRPVRYVALARNSARERSQLYNFIPGACGDRQLANRHRLSDSVAHLGAVGLGGPLRSDRIGCCCGQP